MCTVQSPLPYGKLRLPVFDPAQEHPGYIIMFVLQHTNNHCHPYHVCEDDRPILVHLVDGMDMHVKHEGDGKRWKYPSISS